MKTKSALLLMLTITTIGWASTPISQCGTVISSSGDYHLTRNLVCPNALRPAILVKDTKHVDIELENYSITFSFFAPVPFPPSHIRKLGTAISVVNSKEVEISGKGGAKLSRGRVGVSVSNSEEVKIDRVVFSQNTFGTIYTGQGSQDGKIEDSTFVSNTCDLKVTSGAESPDLDDNGPDVLNLCF